MDENTSLINIGELSRPATVLIEKISDALGGIFKPYQIVRVAKAEAQADRVKAEGQIEISDLQRRAFHRIGEELMPICGAAPVEGFFKFMLDHWKNEGWMTVSELSADNTSVGETR